LKRLVRAGLWVIGFVVVILIAMAYLPMPAPSLRYLRASPLGYSQVVAETEKENRQAADFVQAECASTLLLHGRRTERVYVLLHGFSNCPGQFRAFGEQLFAGGANVYIPRLPLHGEKDRMTTALRHLKPDQMSDASNRAVDLGHSLGRHVTVVGLSVSATVVAWIGRQRSDVDEVVLLAPFFAPKGVARSALGPLMRLTLRLPNRFLWWDSEFKDKDFHGRAYPRFPTHAVAQMMRIGDLVLTSSDKTPPACRKLLLVLTEADETASLPLARELAANWDRARPGSVRTYEFPASEKVDHDFIDPSHPNARTEYVYPKLLELLAK
jgi:pimeloyl-ACP methyl ester carboxylesterase